MMESWHVVGQKVVCIRATSVIRPTGLTEGRVYTIAEVGVGSQGAPVFALAEIDNETRLGFNATRFRPVRPTSVEQFRHLLTPTPERVRELEEVG